MSKRHLVSFTGKSSKMLWNVMIVIWLEQFDLCTQSRNLTTVMKCLSFAFSCHNYIFFWPSFFFSSSSFQMDVSQKCLRSFPVTTLSLFIIVTLLNSWLTSTAFSMRSHPWTQRTQIGETDVFISVWRENMLTSKGNLKYGGPSEVTCCFHDAFVHFLLLFKWLSRDFKVVLKL